MADNTPDELIQLILLQRTIEHQYGLDDLATKHIRQMQRSVVSARKEVLGFMEKKGANIGNWSRKRAEGLLNEFDKMTYGIQNKLAGQMKSLTGEAYEQSVDAYNIILSFER